MATTTIAAVTLWLLALCWLASGQNDVIPQCASNECPAFEVLTTTKDYELRRYAPSKWVVTSYTDPPSNDVTPAPFNRRSWRRKPSSRAFWRLFSYLRGDNSRGVSIPMTVPVLKKVEPQTDGSKTVTMYFMVPSDFQADTPTPTNNSQVALLNMPAQEVYVRVFGGYARGWSMWETELSALENALNDPSLYQGGFYITAGYDSPWRRNGRRNEVWLLKA